MFHKVLVTGGAGYVGCALVPKLLDAGYQVVVYDLMLFGAHGLPRHPNLGVLVGDLRDTGHFATALRGVDAVIHLACIANDPSFELDPGMSKAINYDCFEPMVQACVRAGVRRFIYASTSSVYGVSAAREDAEDHPVVPLTNYSNYKAMCESILRRYESPAFTTVTIRPATVCGYSPRLRLDLTVNLLTNHAVNRRLIPVFGGSQKRPNIHIDDIAELYVQLLETPPALIAGETFNAGYANHTVADLAKLVKAVVEEAMPHLTPVAITSSPTNDTRSYHICSRKIAGKLGYRPRHTIEDAVRDLCRAFQEGKIPNSLTDDTYINVRTVKKKSLAA